MDRTPAAFASKDLVRIRRNPWLLGLAASPLLLTLGAIVTAIAGTPAALAFTMHPLIFAGVALVYVWRRNPRPVIEPARVAADADGVEIDGQRIPRSTIREGFVLPGSPPRVKLRRRWATPIELQVGSTDEARAILRALGLDVTQTVARFRTLSRAVSKRRYVAATLGSFFTVYAVFIIGLTRSRNDPTLAAATGVAFFVGLLAMMTLMLMPTKLSVGADGVVLRWLFRDRFIAYGDIEGAEQYEKGWGRSRHIGIKLTLRSGEEVLIPTGQAKWNNEEMAIIHERMREAMEAFRLGDAAADAALLRRGARDVPEWIAALRAIGSGANADMRTAPLPRERLFRIVESPTAAVAERAAAAVALGGELDDEARGRLRIAAEATASPKLRVVLEAAASGAAEAEMEAALGEAAGEAPKERTAGAESA